MLRGPKIQSSAARRPSGTGARSAEPSPWTSRRRRDCRVTRPGVPCAPKPHGTSVRYRSSSGAGGETGHATFTLGEHRQPIGGVVGGRGARTAEARARSRGRARRGWPARPPTRARLGDALTRLTRLVRGRRPQASQEPTTRAGQRGGWIFLPRPSLEGCDCELLVEAGGLLPF